MVSKMRLACVYIEKDKGCKEFTFDYAYTLVIFV